jgi:hypothetical protein
MMQLDAQHRNQCLTCGNRVTARFGQVFGDPDDRVHRCLRCDTMGRIKHGSGAGIRVDDPDPIVHQGRMTDTPDIQPAARSFRGDGDE